MLGVYPNHLSLSYSVYQQSVSSKIVNQEIGQFEIYISICCHLKSKSGFFINLKSISGSAVDLKFISPFAVNLNSKSSSAVKLKFKSIFCVAIKSILASAVYKKVI